MQRFNSRILLSASDLVTFHECEHASALDHAALDDQQLRAQRLQPDESGQLFIDRGLQFEADYLAQLKLDHPDLVEITSQASDRAERMQERVAGTLDAMRRGAPAIYQATFLAFDGPDDEGLLGHADFLRRVERPSALGTWSYEVIDTKFARKPKAAYVLQLAFYGELLAKAQQLEPHSMHVVLGDGKEVSFATADHSRYFRRLLGRFRGALGRQPEETYPTPCDRCETCGWRSRCEDQREAEDSLFQVAGIRSSQVHNLQAAGVHTLRQLGRLAPKKTIAHLVPESLAKLREQAAMQLQGRETGRLVHQLVSHAPGEPRGLTCLPPPDSGDVYFDMEGDPLFGDGGLEYLFGVLYRDEGQWVFKPFWGHDRAGERQAFEQFMDWLRQRIDSYPGLHVYHYAAYEDSALKRLAGRHSTREGRLDQLLRERRLVDLYKVVRESIRASTPSYSIKHIEKFYREARAGDVQTAGASIVYYERFLQTRDEKLSSDIERYNEDDVRSLQQLHEWLLAQRPVDMPWRGDDGDEENDGDTERANRDAGPTGLPSAKLQAYLDAVAAIRKPLLAALPADETRWTAAQRARALVADLLEFHRRCEKPQWWDMFQRAELSFDELLESVDAIAGLKRVPDATGAAGLGAATGMVGARGTFGARGTVGARITADEYEYPPQDIKLEEGTYAVWLEHPEGASVKIVEVDEERRRIWLKPSRKSGALPETLSLGKGGPIDTQVLKDALLRVGQSFVDGEHRYRALEAYLEKRLPKIKGRRTVGRPIVADPKAPLEDIVAAVKALDQSYLFIQGPPGAGKTYTGSHVIASLLEQGKRVAVSSNSHKAINNLLAGVEKVMLERGHTERCMAKKSSRGDENAYPNGRLVMNVDDNDDALNRRWKLVAGTAWLFARPEADQEFDYLFVDEAGQISLGHLAAMGACARNIVLLGDQMQLSQPIQGVHPGRSGESSLDYLLDGHATVAPQLGIFLPTTWRMCPDVCRFISDAVYDGRLLPEEKNSHQRLLLAKNTHPALKPTGVVFWPMNHVGCSQRSVEEAQEIERIYQSLLQQSWLNRDGEQHRITPDDILVVAPYNLQVRFLKSVLPAAARVGTVDKFQGQEAAVTLISMTTSSEDDLPRHIEFLFSKNRLNVAISRARCLSVVVANPRLLDTRCKTPQQIALVNTLCWVAEYHQQTAQ